MIRGLVFDFDGLILETEGPILQSWQELYAAHDCTLDLETWSVLLGTADAVFDPLDLLEERVGRAIDRAQLAPARLQRELELVSAQEIMPGVLDLLDAAAARGLKLAVASASYREWVYGHLQRLGLFDRFETVKVSDDVIRSKPDPALYRLAVESLGIAPAEAIAFEDSPNGVLAAKRAGLRVVAVPNELTGQLDLSAADLIVPSLTQVSLEELLTRFSNGRV
jgi:HAD superfamily hydrolase (TIGR01509 family)